MFHRMMNFGELEARPSIVLTKDLIKKSMPRYKRHDDLLVIQEQAWEAFKKSMPIPVVNAENSPFSVDEDELASLVCQTVQRPACRRLAIERGIRDDGFRTPIVELILGDNGVVDHKDNHILYQFDVTKCMFSFGNVREKMRIAKLDCSNEIVVDLFAGIGYFSLPLLVHAKAKHLYACEWNPDAFQALKNNLKLNKIDSNRYTIIEGDNRPNRPTDVAQRVILGILPSCMDWMRTAFECIDKKTGAILHCHDLVETKSTQVIDKQSSTELSEASSTSEKPHSSDSHSILNQSYSSSSSSHSTIEKISSPFDEKLFTNESDTSSPVLVEKPVSSAALSPSVEASNHVNNETSSMSSQLEESITESPNMNESETNIYEARGHALIARIKEELDAHDLNAKLLHIQPVKSYAPHVNHIVFDIKIEPSEPPEAATNNHNSTKHDER